MSAPVLGGALAAALLLGGASPAHAEPDPSPSAPSASAPESDTPSADEVRLAAEAVAATAGKVEAVEADLAQARTHLEQVHEAAAVAAEASNKAEALLAQRTSSADAADAQAREAASAAARAELAMQQVATQVYMQGGSLGGLELLFELRNGDIARRAAGVDASMDYRTDANERAASASQRAQSAKRAAAQAQLQQKAAAGAAEKALAKATKSAQAAEAEAAQIERTQAALVTDLARLRRTSVAVEQRRQEGLQAQARAAEEASVRAAQEQGAAAAQAALQARTSVSTPAGPLPAARRSAAATAVSFAKAQLGEPYQWAAAGPDRWDCSGLTMGAWKAAGRSLPHYSGWQYQQTRRVPIANLEPGDLVFFGKSESSIHHVGLYVGKGQMIEAPRTGLNVRYSSIYRSSLLPYGGRP